MVSVLDFFFFFLKSLELKYLTFALRNHWLTCNDL